MPRVKKLRIPAYGVFVPEHVASIMLNPVYVLERLRVRVNPFRYVIVRRPQNMGHQSVYFPDAGKLHDARIFKKLTWANVGSNAVKPAYGLVIVNHSEFGLYVVPEDVPYNR